MGRDPSWPLGCPDFRLAPLLGLLYSALIFLASTVKLGGAFLLSYAAFDSQVRAFYAEQLGRS